MISAASCASQSHDASAVVEAADASVQKQPPPLVQAVPDEPKKEGL
jgi:hypothetical protein